MKKGVTIIFVVGILLILFIFTATLLFVFTFWEKSCYKIVAGKQAERFAKAGIDDGIWEIEHDGREYDSFFDNWRKNFEGQEVDNNEDGIPDSKWIYIYGKDREIIGRYSVLIEDENGKINLNSCGNLKNSFNEGFSVSEINILTHVIGKESGKDVVRFRYGKDGLPGKGSFDEDCDNNSVSNDRVDNDGDGKIDEIGEGIDEPDEFSCEKLYGDDRLYFVPEDIKLVKGIGEKKYGRIRNLITVFSYDKNVTGKGKERINLNKADFESLYLLFREKGYPEQQAIQIALNIIDYRDPDSVPATKEIDGKLYIGIDKTPYLNEIDAVKPWKKLELPSGTVMFIEEGGQFIEIFNPYLEKIDIGGWKIKGVITLFSNLWDEIFESSEEIYNDVINGETEIEQDKAKSIIESVIPTTIRIPKGTEIPPLSYYTIGDRIRIVIIIPPEGIPVVLFLPIEDPSECQQYEPILAINPGSFGFLSDILSNIPFLSNLGLDFTVSFYDREGNIIEIADYPTDAPQTSVQKNDPRMKGIFDWYPAFPTPNMQNLVFSPWIGGEFGKTGWIYLWPTSFVIKNGNFSSVGELSFIHRMEHWKSMDFWKEGKDRKIIDYFTVVENPEKPTYGRLNINTASETVLMCLPLVDKKLARRIIKARPYTDISEVLGIYGKGNSEKEILNREITKYGFDRKDNDFDGFLDCEKEKEMIFSKIINLITVRSNVFKIISTGQKVKDKNGNGKIEKEEIIAERKIVVFYDRDKRKVIYRKEL